MYAKIFSQIFESSIAEDWKVRHVFEDFLKLADIDGVVDMTLESIARRANMPLEMVQYGIEKLTAPDLKSRSKEKDGRRLVPLDDHRGWGWIIVNYTKYRTTVDDQTRRAQNRNRVKRFRSKEKQGIKKGNAPSRSVTVCNAPVTRRNASSRYVEEEVDVEAEEKAEAVKQQKPLTQPTQALMTAGLALHDSRKKCSACPSLPEA